MTDIRRTTHALLIAALSTGLGAALVLVGVSPAGADQNEAGPYFPGFASLSLGYEHSCGVRYDGAVKCWGANNLGQLGQGDTDNRGDGAAELGADLPAVDLGTGRTALTVAAAFFHTCALLDNHSVKCWGNNGDGQLGLGDVNSRGDGPGEMGDNLPTVDLGTGRTAVSLSAGGGHTCAVLDDASLKCWGYNQYAQLGQPNTANQGDGANEMGNNLPAVDLGTGHTVLTVSAGGGHTCAILDDKSVKCWGHNTDGQLGLGDTLVHSATGDALPAVDLGTGRTANALSAGSLHTCALLNNNEIKCWGGNAAGQLGLGDGDNRGDGPAEMGDNLSAVDLGAGFAGAAWGVSAGEIHTCALLNGTGAYTVKCWGGNTHGQLGAGNTTPRGKVAGEMGDNLPAVVLGSQTYVHYATALTIGANHTCALLHNDTIKCWGSGSSGKLGLGDVANRGDDPDEMSDFLPSVDLPPGNDDFADATPVAGASGEAVSSTANATLEPGETTPGSRSVWFRWTAPASGQATFETPELENYGHVLSAFTGTAVNALASVGSDDRLVSFAAVSGTTYSVAVSGTHNSGRVALSWQLAVSTPPPAAPVKRCRGKVVTVDLALGQKPTNKSDVILGTKGNDKIKARGGNDLVCGGKGKDRIDGGGGKDKLFGEGGKDKLLGRGGNDKLDGGGGKDNCIGGPGKDKLKRC